MYDITRTITPNIAVWPGSEPFSFIQTLYLEKGDSVNLTTITLTPHTGTHADAHFHYDNDGLHPAAMPLDVYVGPARVVTIARREGAITPQDIGSRADGAERLLIRSHVSSIPDHTFPDPFPYLSVELIDMLAAQHIKLIGLDSPSVDDINSKDLPAHHALNRHGIPNIELLQLQDVPDGDYELIALPLKMGDVCGSPVRAILRTLA